jgi:hypothetical protein
VRTITFTQLRSCVKCSIERIFKVAYLKLPESESLAGQNDGVAALEAEFDTHYKLGSCAVVVNGYHSNFLPTP